MARFGQYPQADFKTNQKYLAQEASGRVVRVSGQDIIDAIDQGQPYKNIVEWLDERVEYFRTTDLALQADLEVGRVIYTTGTSAENDGGQAHFVVVIGGTSGSIAMDNGNGLLNLDLTSPFVSKLDSVENDLPGLEGIADGQQISVAGYLSGSTENGPSLVWDSNQLKSDHDGKYIFSPTVPWSNFDDYIAAVGETDPGGSGCWIALSKRKPENVTKVDSIQSGIPGLAGFFDGEQISVTGYYDDADQGGGQFYWDSNRAKSDHNGGTVISPTVPFNTISDYLNGVGETDPGGKGCWVKIKQEIHLNPYDFGATGAGSGESDILNKLISVSGYLNTAGETFFIESDLIIDSTQSIKVFGFGEITASVGGLNMFRVRNGNHVFENVTINGADIDNNLGLNIESTATGSVIRNCSFKDISRSAIFTSASKVEVSDNTLSNIGLGATASGNFRVAILQNGDECLISNNNISDCNWGIYIRQDIGDTANIANKVLGNTIRASALASSDNQGISAQNNNQIQISDNFISDFNDNAIDNQACNGSIITANSAINCKDGIFIGDRSCFDHLISDNVIQSCVRGVRLINGTGFENQTFRGITISNNTFRSCSEGGVLAQIEASGSTGDNIQICDNIINSSDNGLYGIKCSGIDNSIVARNNFYRQPGDNIEVVGCDALFVYDNSFTDPGFGGTGNAVNVYSSSFRIFIKNNYAIGSATTAYNIVDGASHTVNGNRWRSIATGVAIGTATNVTQFDNLAV